jgi:hypothetical protein
MRTTNAHELKMEWRVYKTGRNAANPYTVAGYVNGVCRLECAVSRKTASSATLLERLVVDRLKEIATPSQHAE